MGFEFDWRNQYCSLCGDSKRAYIVIMISCPTPGLDEQYQYSDHRLCKECWDEFGIDVAIEANKQIMEDL